MLETTFVPFQRVLVRDEDTEKWDIDIFHHIAKDAYAEPCIYCCFRTRWKQCIPYENNEHLFGTTGKPQNLDGSFKEKHFTNCRHSNWYGETMEEELRPFQPVLVRDDNEGTWQSSLFSHIHEHKGVTYYVCMNGIIWNCCVPYNDETVHLLGTSDSPTPPEPPFRFGDKVEVRNDNGPWRKAVYCKTYAKDEARDRFCVMVKEGMLCYKYCRHADW